MIKVYELARTYTLEHVAGAGSPTDNAGFSVIGRLQEGSEFYVCCTRHSGSDAMEMAFKLGFASM